MVPLLLIIGQRDGDSQPDARGAAGDQHNSLPAVRHDVSEWALRAPAVLCSVWSPSGRERGSHRSPDL